MSDACDILVIGAGPVGLSFAAAMAQSGLKITLIDRQSRQDLENPAYDGREIALNQTSKNLMEELGIWQKMPQDEISEIKAAHVLNGLSPYALSFDGAKVDRDLGFLISNHHIRQACFDVASALPDVTLMTDTDVAKVSTDDTGAKVTLRDGRVLEAPMLIAADTRFSPARKMMGIKASTLEFGRSCIVCKMEAEKPHEDIAYEGFLYERTLAILPLSHNQVSVVITIGTEDADALLELSPEDFARDIERHCEGRYGTMKLVTDRYAYPLVATFASRFDGRRFALLGDAAVGMHPVTAHGFNFGLLGAYTLANDMMDAKRLGQDFYAQSVLARYSDQHRKACLPLYHFTNAMVTLYTKTSPLAKLARHALLRAANITVPAKRVILKNLTKYASERG